MAVTDTDRRSTLHADHPAYLIYTSGSTGQPKAVINTHKNVVRLLDGEETRSGFGSRQHSWLMFHSFMFDFSVWEIWGALLHGGRLVIVPKRVTRSPKQLRHSRAACHCRLPDAFGVRSPRG